MKNIVKYVFFIILFLLSNIFYVNASCTNEDITILEKRVNQIKVTYKHLGEIEVDGDFYYNQFEVNIDNIPDDLYLSVDNGNIIINPIDGKIKENFNNGTWIFDFYSYECNIKIDSINVFIPRFNVYSLDPLCNGIDGNDFPLCGKYYEYDVSYSDFRDRVNNYRNTHNISNIEDKDDEKGILELFINKLLEYLNDYYIYILGFILLIIFIIIIVIINKSKKNRGVLK